MKEVIHCKNARNKLISKNSFQNDLPEILSKTLFDNIALIEKAFGKLQQFTF